MQRIKKFTVAAVTAITLVIPLQVIAAEQQDGWAAYVDGTVGRDPYYLYQQVMAKYFHQRGSYRAINFGAGAGDVDIDLAVRGFDVTSIDQSQRSKEVISERARFVDGKVNFQQSDFAAAQLSGQYDLITSFFALPFGNKNDLAGLIKNISRHTKTGSILAVNFFGNQHSFVKSGDCYGVSKDEVYQLLAANGFTVKYFLNRFYTQNDFNNNKTDWDLLDVIAVKM